MLIVIIGESGAGKTTLRNHLCDKYGFRLANGLPGKPVRDGERVVVDWPPQARPPFSPPATMETLPIMAGPIGAGRDLVGAVELLGGVVIEVNAKRLSGIGVVLPSGARGVDDGRLLRTADRLMDLLGVGKADAKETRKEFGATALFDKPELDAVLAMLGKPVVKKRSPALRRAIAELSRAKATLDPRNEVS